MEEVSIVGKTNDQYSTALKKMSNTTKAFQKDVVSMEAGLQHLSGERPTKNGVSFNQNSAKC